MQKEEYRVRLVRRKEVGYCNFLVFVWMDCKRKYSICSGSNMSDGVPNTRSILHQKNEEPTAKLDNINLVIDQSKAYELYYSCCAIVYRHNHCR